MCARDHKIKPGRYLSFFFFVCEIHFSHWDFLLCSYSFDAPVSILPLQLFLKKKMFTALGSISHKKFYMFMQNEQKLEFCRGNFDFHFQIGDMPPRVFPICFYREAMRLQCFPPTRYVKWARILCLNN